MKKILLSIGALALMLSANSQSTARTVLLEHFTQASCGPCATYNPAVMNYLNTTSNSMVSIKYQVWWPGYDPMYLHNESDVNDRVSLYSISGVPSSVIDGNVHNGSPITASGGWTDATVTNRAAQNSPFEVTLSHEFNAAVDTITVTMKVKASDVTTGNLVAQIAVVEEQINFSTPPGSNGETIFYSVMKKMLPSSSGTTLPSSWAVGDSVVITESWAMANVYDISEIGVVAFVQNTSSSEVMQAAKSAANFTPPAGAVEADISSSSSHTAPASLCDDAFIPKISVNNNSSNMIDTFQVSYVLNGGSPVVADIFTNLAGGASYTHTFDTVTLSVGANTIQYYSNTSADASTYDLAQINNASDEEVVYVTTPIAFDTTHEEGFEGMTNGDETPVNSITVNPDGIRAYAVNGQINGSGADLGGYGNSFTSYRWDFYAILVGQSSIIWENLDFTNNGNHGITFDRAYAQYTNENDALKVEVSTDCGDNWTTVYNQGGSNLSTTGASTSRFYPTASTWATDSVDLSDYDGEASVMIKMTGISDYGNSLYVDNINMYNKQTAPVVSSIDSDVFGGVSIFPNPANDVIHISLENVSKSKVALINMLGEVVRTEQFNSNNHSIHLSDLNTGTYFVKVTSENGQVYTEKVVVE